MVKIHVSNCMILTMININEIPSKSTRKMSGLCILNEMKRNQDLYFYSDLTSLDGVVGFKAFLQPIKVTKNAKTNENNENNVT